MRLGMFSNPKTLDSFSKDLTSLDVLFSLMDRYSLALFLAIAKNLELSPRWRYKILTDINLETSWIFSKGSSMNIVRGSSFVSLEV